MVQESKMNWRWQGEGIRKRRFPTRENDFTI